MNILFITIGRINSIYEKEIYPDLIRQLVDENNTITVLRFSSETSSKVESGGVYIYNKYLKGIRGNVSSIQKGLAYLLFPFLCTKFLRKNKNKYDLVISSTPPVTISFVLRYLKRKGVYTYLLQKDIFPEDAIDLGVLKKTGLKGFAYRFFRYCENKAYSNASYIGAMSKGCVDYLIQHNSNINLDKIEINPNSIIPSCNNEITIAEKIKRRIEYGLPTDKIIFIYGGNIGDAQGIDFINCLFDKIDIKNVLFLFLGEGKGFDYLKNKYERNDTFLFRPTVSSQEYYRLVGCCDVGLVFLSSLLTVPNVPSRMLFYMDNYLPILAAVDFVSDIYRIINEERIGFCCHSIEKEICIFVDYLNKMLDDKNRILMGKRSKEYLSSHWSCKESTRIILKHFGDN